MAPAAAAFFDFDRTLIDGGSGPILQRHLADAGFGSDTEIPGMEVFYQIYKTFGENPLAMQAARLAVRASKGWPVDAVAKAAEAAAEELDELILPYGRQLIAQHHEAGRQVVLATTTPRHLVAPLAERLGIDAVVASEWATTTGPDGDTYTGELDGEFAWGRNKMTAIKGWAKANGIELKKSYAYSDSVYDVPMLRVVGYPVAVNPDPQLTAVATLNRWPIRHLDVPPGVLKLAGREIQHWLRPFNRPEMVPYADIDIAETDTIPADGGAIVVFNHRSYFDSTVINFVLAKAGRPARFLGKKEVFDVPVVGRIASMVGGIRVDRGTGSDEPLEKAIAALDAGELVAMAPQGTIPRGPAFFDPELKGRWGAAKLAHATKVPVIPVALWGTEKVWPRSQRLPSMDVTSPPKVTAVIGSPVKLAYRSLDADTKRIMTAIADLLPPEASEVHNPTLEELARTFPPGYSGDPTQEADRRPGTDTVSSGAGPATNGATPATEQKAKPTKAKSSKAKPAKKKPANKKKPSKTKANASKKGG